MFVKCKQQYNCRAIASSSRKKIKKGEISVSETSDQTQQVRHSKKWRQDKDIKSYKKSQSLGKKIANSKQLVVPM